MSSLRRQRGAVVILAMFVVALAAISAGVMLERQDYSLRQLETARDQQQARWLLHGGLQWARVILRADARAGAIDHAGELWASGLPPTDVDEGNIAGEIRDQQGLFNLNNLVRDGRASAHDVLVLKRLLALSGLRPELADAIADWIDADDEPLSSDGAEDGYYLALDPSYRAPNQPMMSMDELLRVRGCDRATLARLRQVATVLPKRTPVNVNLAPAEVLAALVEGLALPEAQVVAGGRRTAPFASRDEFKARLPRPEMNVGNDDVSADSQYFLVQGRARVGRTELRLQSLVYRAGTGLPEVVWQRAS